MITKDVAIASLQSASQGLQFQSETDAPFETFFWPIEGSDTVPLSPQRVLELADAKPDTQIKSTTLATFFRGATKEEEWHNEEEKAEVEKFKALVVAIKNTLTKPQVFRVGETSIDIYIVGAVEGGWGGLKTRVVET